jgi:propanol-preferring alcohol dehydrogenase
MAAADVQIPSSYKAVVYDNPGTLSTKVIDMDMPEVPPGQVLINL